MNTSDFSSFANMTPSLAKQCIDVFLSLAKSDERVKKIELSENGEKVLFDCHVVFSTGGELNGIYSLQRIAGSLYKEPNVCLDVQLTKIKQEEAAKEQAKEIRARKKEAKKQAALALENAEKFYLTGETYEIKELLKHKFGARWDGDKRSWYVLEEPKHQEAQNFINEQAEIAKELLEQQRAIEQERQLERQKESLEFVKHVRALASRPTVDERAFIRDCAISVKRGDIQLATQVHQYRGLHSKYTEYFNLVGLPDDIRNRNCAEQIRKLPLDKII